MPIRNRLVAAILTTVCALPLSAQNANPQASGPTTVVTQAAPAAAPAIDEVGRSAVETTALAGNLKALSTLAIGYHEGRSVEPDPAKAFYYDRAIVRGFSDVSPGGADAELVVAALLRLASAYTDGIPDADIAPRQSVARSLLTHGATVFGSSEAQYRLGVSLLAGAGTDERRSRRAGRWLLLAARKGHVPAQIALGRHLSDQPSPASQLRGAYWLEEAGEQPVAVRQAALTD